MNVVVYTGNKSQILNVTKVEISTCKCLNCTLANGTTLFADSVILPIDDD